MDIMELAHGAIVPAAVHVLIGTYSEMDVFGAERRLSSHVFRHAIARGMAELVR
jgi:hypothetical protein